MPIYFENLVRHHQQRHIGGNEVVDPENQNTQSKEMIRIIVGHKHSEE